VRQSQIFFWITQIILGSLLICFPEYNFLVFYISMQAIFLINKFAYLIKNELFVGAILIRRTLYFIPYIMVFFFLDIQYPKQNTQGMFYLTILAVFIAIPFLWVRKEELARFFDREFNLFIGGIKAKDMSLECYSLMCSAILQELFYKACIIALLLLKMNPFIAIIISSFLFVSEHVLHTRNKKFEWKDYVVQFLLSSSAGILYVLGGNVLYPIITHMVYNGVIASTHIYRYIIGRSVHREENAF
jgi:membrane protease YdiL (CAAX protease family)